jgi:hypothetical protein
VVTWSRPRAEPAIIVRARNRKEFGNPPGKAVDCLGDQISWEQLLSRYEGQNLWIVTADRDFCDEFNNVLYLNPLLHQELAERGGEWKAEVFPFDSLAKALAHYNKMSARKSESLPAQEVLDQIEEEERTLEDSAANPAALAARLFTESPAGIAARLAAESPAATPCSVKA